MEKRGEQKHADLIEKKRTEQSRTGQGRQDGTEQRGFDGRVRSGDKGLSIWPSIADTSG